jgi:outer membrane protein assembly factor BamB
MHVRKLAFLAVSLFALSLPALASDWPQWRGPDRTDVSKETGLLKSWPDKGPHLLWTFRDAGVGYFGPAIVGDRLYSMGADDQNEYVFVLDVKSGQKVWSCEIGKRFKNGYGDGPRATPTVDGDRLYALGGQGSLVCVDVKSGKKIWSLSMQKDLGGQMMSGWGYTESPLVDGDKLICAPGGDNGMLAAVDKNTGKVLWRSKDLTDPASYSSLLVADVSGTRQYLVLTGRGQAGVAAKDGRLLWHTEYCINGVAMVPTPIFQDGSAYFSTDYGAGCALLKLTPDGNGTRAEKIYANKNMENHHGGVILLDGYLYGWSGNSNYRGTPRGKWVCQELKTGKVVWEEKDALGAASITYADGHLYCYSQDDGTVVLLRATPKGWKEDGRFKIPEETKVPRKSGRIWTHPVVANGRLYLRDEDLIFCYDVRATN